MNGSDSVQRGIELSERLVRTVGRAFYTDNVVVVLDALVSDKYLAEKELPIRLQLRPKDISRVLSQLVRERLVHTEELEGALYYFINYRAFANVIRYRVFCMQKRMKEAENLNIHFKCPTCGAIYSAIEVQHLKSKDMQFVCSFCCPGNNFRAIISEPRFRLVGVDNIATDFSERKLNKQLSRSGQGEPFHEGIFDLLKELRNCPLIQNKPSDNKERGIGPGAIPDEDIRQALEDLLQRENKSNKKVKANEEQQALLQAKSLETVPMREIGVTAVSEAGEDEDVDMDSTAWEDA